MKHLVPIIVAASFLISAASITTAVIVTNNQNKKIKELEKQISTTVESTLPDDSVEITVEDQDKDKNNNKDKDKNNKTTQVVYKDKNAQYRQYELDKENTRHESAIKKINDSYKFTASDEATYKTYNYNEVVAEMDRLRKAYNDKELAYEQSQELEYQEHACGEPGAHEAMEKYNQEISAKKAKAKSEYEQAEKDCFDYEKFYEKYTCWYHSYNNKQKGIAAENELHQKNVNEINQKYR